MGATASLLMIAAFLSFLVFAMYKLRKRVEESYKALGDECDFDDWKREEQKYDVQNQ